MVERQRGIGIATAGAGLLGASVATALLLDETVLGIKLVDWRLAPLLLLGVVALHLLLRGLAARGVLSAGALSALGTLCLSTAISLFALDTAYALYLNTSRQAGPDLAHLRLNDPRLWMGEVLPRWHEPTARNFHHYKKGIRLEAEVYGAFYNTRMLDSPTLVESVLELRPIDFEIDENGFRDTTPLGEARHFALGDSFVFGYGVGQDAIWPEQIEDITGLPWYNLGVSSTSPGQQVRLLEHLLETRGDALRIEHLVWMIFEGNDLEESYLEWSYVAPGAGSLLDGTVLQTLREIPRSWKHQSVLHRMLSGGITARPIGSIGANGAHGANGARDPYRVDGVPIGFPLYHSARHGHRMFHPDDMQHAAEPLAYVLEHPNWPHLVESFERMQALAREHAFSVTVALAPSAARLYGPWFEGFPALSAEPHLLLEVSGLAHDAGFDVIDLVAPLRGRAEQELLYFRDDHHWNARGNRVVAELLAEHLHARAPERH